MKYFNFTFPGRCGSTPETNNLEAFDKDLKDDHNHHHHHHTLRGGGQAGAPGKI